MRWVLMAAAAAVGLSGCTTPPDVMVFGTTTKLAVDVSAQTTTGGLPEITVGYKRAEGVWMPLAPGTAPTRTERRPDGTVVEDRQLTEVQATTLAALEDCSDRLRRKGYSVREISQLCASLVLPSMRYVSVASDTGPGSNQSRASIDAYSVFASFGAKGSIANGAGSSGLAQIFATGVAAQRLADNPTVGLALNNKAPAAVGELARSEATLAEAELGQAIIENTSLQTRLSRVVPACLDSPSRVAALKGLGDTEISDLVDNAAGPDDFFDDLENDKVELVLQTCEGS